jgi:hypothetical protein
LRVEDQRCLLFHLVAATGSKERAMLSFDTKVRVTEAKENDKLTVKQIMTEFRVGKTEVYNILNSKYKIKN